MLHCAQNIWARHISILYICRKGKNNQMHSTEKKKKKEYILISWAVRTAARSSNPSPGAHYLTAACDTK